MIRAGLQNTLLQDMSDYGCYFIDLCKVIEMETRKEINLIDMAYYAIQRNYMGNDFEMKLPAKFLEDFLNTKVTIHYTTTKPNTRYYVECWYNDRTGYTHFKLPDWDSLTDSVTVKEGYIKSYRAIYIGE